MFNAGHCHASSTTDPDDHARGLPEFHQRYLQTGPGRFEGTLQRFDLAGDVVVYREQVNVPTAQEGWLAKGWRTFGISMSESSSTLQGRAVGATIGHLQGGGDWAVQTAGPTDHVGIVIRDETFAQYAEYLGGVDGMSWASLPLLETSQPAREHASAGIGNCLLAAADNPGALTHQAARTALRDSILEHLFCLLIDAQPARRRNDVTRLTYSEIVNRSREHLMKNPGSPAGLLEFCQLLRISRRTLQTAFLDVTGVTPQAYMRAVRLSSVHKVLRQADAPEINVVAASWGFVNMGRFAADYRLMFGYLPSETARTCGTLHLAR